MNKILLILACLLFSAPFLSAQCSLQLLSCPSAPQEHCDETANNAQLWNEAYWWSPLYSLHDLAEGAVNLQITVVDTCSSGGPLNIRYRLRLDLDGNGSRETVVDSDQLPGWNTVYFNNANADSLTGGAARKFDERPVPADQQYGFALQISTSGDTTAAAVRWNTLAAPGAYALPELPHEGLHEIEWTITRGHEVKTCKYPLSVKDCKKPVVQCINGLSVNIMPTQMITLWDTDFLMFTQDNITPDNQLVTAIRQSGTGAGFPTTPDGLPQKSVSFDCLDLGTQLVEVWSKDKAGNVDFCETYVIVQDNATFCNIDPPYGSVCIKTACGLKGVEDVGIEIEGSSPGIPPIFYPFLPSGPDGCLSFNPLPIGGSYSIIPVKDNDPLNGVSTYDLVLINKHILGLEPLNLPYKIIAADANKSRSVTTFDIVELRKLILGIYTELPNNTSWRFVPKYYTFPNPANPFQSAFPESLSFVSGTNIPLDFLAIKIGDVNCNAVTSNLAAPTETRGASALLLPEARLAAGQVVETPLALPAETAWLGLQGALEFDTELLELLDVRAGVLPGMDAEAFAQPRPGLLSWSWWQLDANALAAGTPVLQLRWRAKKPVRLSEAVRLDSKFLPAEAYAADGQALDLQLLFGQTVNPAVATVFAAQPNPTATGAVLPLQLPAPQRIRVELLGPDGRLLYRQQAELPAGFHQLELPASAFGPGGAYVWRVQTGDGVHTGRLLKL